MRRIERTTQFKKDFKREAKGLHRAALADDFIAIVTALANDKPLAEKHRDHALTGEWKDHRDCHIKPDLVLIYRRPDAAVLQLVRLGSHSELGLIIHASTRRCGPSGRLRDG
ncbi:MAG TPA: type II toxin-antitoxin system YafQ family toxin [Stellaceae bacterium]|nr:type II toxin-antitoxin system YafQ family toxin [Stellaceae bacterium]